MKSLCSSLLIVCALFLSACTDPAIEQAILTRRTAIESEPRGEWFIGRRFFIEHTQFWGYLRRPGQPWEEAQLIIMNEREMRQPDRVPEFANTTGLQRGYDRGYEYKIWGRFSGRKVYDPNADLFLPEFILSKWELVSKEPGWLFKPNEKFDGKHLLRWSEQDQMMRTAP